LIGELFAPLSSGTHLEKGVVYALGSHFRAGYWNISLGALSSTATCGSREHSSSRRVDSSVDGGLAADIVNFK
jgi:hypothetical protein